MDESEEHVGTAASRVYSQMVAHTDAAAVGGLVLNVDIGRVGALQRADAADGLHAKAAAFEAAADIAIEGQVPLIALLAGRDARNVAPDVGERIIARALAVMGKKRDMFAALGV